MGKYAVVLRYITDVEIEDVEANSQVEAIAKARSKVDGSLEHYMIDSTFYGTLSVEEKEE